MNHLNRVFFYEWMSIYIGQIIANHKDNGAVVAPDFNYIFTSSDELVQIPEITHKHDGTRHLEIIVVCVYILYASII
jgi:hypothetical protein